MKRDVKDICSRILTRYKKEVRVIALDRGRIMLLVSGKRREIKSYASQLDKTVEVKLISDYLGNILQWDSVTYKKLSDLDIIFDPVHFLDPLQDIIASGEVEGTKEAIMGKFLAIEGHMKKIEAIKRKVVDNLYNSSIEISQALLIKEHGVYSKPKDTPSLLQKRFVKKKRLEARYVETLNKIIVLSKSLEHGKIKTISGKEIDLLLRDVDSYTSRLLDLLEK